MAIITTREIGATAIQIPLSNAQLDNNFINLNADIATRVPASEKGAVNGVATLDASGLVPTAQLPSYVDDVLEAANFEAFPASGETGKIYVALDTNKTYRWSGSAYIYITSGAVDSVAGKTGVVTLVKADVGLANVDNTSDADKPVSTATQTALNTKQATLVSGTSIKTVNGESVLGNGNIQIDGGVTSFNTRTGAVTLSSGDVTGALGFTPYNSTNPNGYLSGTVAINNGGTGATTAAAALTALGAYPASNPNNYLSGNSPTIYTPRLIGLREQSWYTQGDMYVHQGSYFSVVMPPWNYLGLNFYGQTRSTSDAYSVILTITNGGAGTVAYPYPMEWAAGTPPTLTASGKDVLGFVSLNGGNNWMGFVIGKDVR